ncbi:MAG: PAS domain S-box protein, partial [Dehalococcoidia bacterium]|nr:PAS domain S-box protein [Dehalococcoidia bacterium]
MAIPLGVLIIEDRPQDAELMAHELVLAGFEPKWQRVESAADFLARLDSTIDLILADYSLPQFDAMQALQLMQSQSFDIPFIIVSALISEETAVLAMKQGATDYLLKDRLARLGPAVARALEQRDLRRDKRLAEAALRESERRHRELVEALPQSVFEIDEHGFIIFANRSGLEAFGYTQEDLVLDLNFRQAVSPNSVRKAEERFQRRLAGADIGEDEYEFLRKDGSVFPGVLYGRTILRQGKIAGMSGFIVDISERKRAEDAVRAALEESYRSRTQTSALLDAARSVLEKPDFGEAAHAVVATCRDLIEARAGYVFLKAMNGVEDQILSLESGKLHRGVDPWLSTLIRGLGAEALLTGKAVLVNDLTDSQWATSALEGHAKVDSLLLVPLLNLGEATGLLAFANKTGGFTDHDLRLADAFSELVAIALQKSQSRESLAKSEERYRTLVRTSPDAIMLTDMEANILIANDQTAIFLGFARAEELIGMSALGFVASPDSELSFDKWKRSQDVSAVCRIECELVRKDGSYLPVEINVALIADSEQKPYGLGAVIRDITDRKRAEAALRSNRDLLATMSRAQSHFIGATNPDLLFGELLTDILLLTSSESGFIGEILRTENGDPTLRTFAISNIAWEKESREFYEKNSPSNMSFFNLEKLFGAVMTSGKPMIANDPAADPRRGGLPEGHPPLHSFLGLPIYCGDELLGLVGLANRPEKYDDELVAYLQPLLATCGSIIAAFRNDEGRKKAERELQESIDRLRKTLEGVIMALALIVETRDPYTAGHQRRVAELASAIAREIGL